MSFYQWEVFQKVVKTVPREASSLASSVQILVKQLHYTESECGQHLTVVSNTVVMEIASQHLVQPDHDVFYW